MGTYYRAACDAAKQTIDPGYMNDLGMKHSAISHPNHPFGPILSFAMSTRWIGGSVRLVSDNVEDE